MSRFHKAIIVPTDAIDTSSKLTAAQVSGVASSIDVPVFVISTATSIDRRREPSALSGHWLSGYVTAAAARES